MVRGFFLLVFRLVGWEVKGALPADVKKFVMIVAPHTSYWDFPIGIASRSILNLKGHFLIKAELFKNPVSAWFFRLLGGIPVDRSSKDNNFVDTLAEEYIKREEFCIVITPEGTRAKVGKWKTGFHRIARAANVPILMVAFDFKEKFVEVKEPFYPTQDTEKDIQHIMSYYRGVSGKHPELGID